MNITSAIQLVRDFFQNNLCKEANVIGVIRSQDTWSVEVETVEDSEYLRRRAQDDIMAVYEVEVDNSGQIVKYQRKGLRSRSQLEFQTND